MISRIKGLHDYKEKEVKEYKFNANNSNYACLVNRAIRKIK